MLGKKRSDWLEDVREGGEIFVEQATSLHQVQASRQAIQPKKTPETKQKDMQLGIRQV